MQKSKKEVLLDRGREHIFSTGIDDATCHLSRANMKYGLANIHFVQKKYGMEPDEQSRACQYKSLTEIKQQTVQEWLETHFDYKEENTDVFSVKVESYLLD